MPAEFSERVIIARNEDKAAPLIASLKEKGITSFAVTVTRIVYDLSKELPQNFNSFNWIAFTSANGVSAFADILSKNRYELAEHLRIAAVGFSTAAAVEDKLRRKSIVPRLNTAKSLAELMLSLEEDLGKVNVLWPCGEDALPDFENIMVGGGGVVNRWVCYRSEKIDQNIIRSKLESLLPWNLVFFAAPSAVEAFAGAWKDRSGFTAVAIGPTTGEALRNSNFENIIISIGTSINDCTETILKTLNERVRG